MAKRVVAAMSGGVDSSVAAYRLAEAGFEVIGVFMRTGIFAQDKETGVKRCCSANDARDARSVAQSLKIRFFVQNFQREFKELIDYFCREYSSGRTPNPCIICNQRLKFGRLLHFARSLKAEYVATGHYARIEKSNGRFLLKRGLDPAKDQAYVLFSLSQEQLSRAIFPLGEMKKSEVRKIARKLGLKTKDKPESQEICFVPGNNYHLLLRERLANGIRPGKIVDLSGCILGEHPGIEFFTIGQRHGLGIAAAGPLYVVGIDREKDLVIVGGECDLYRTTFLVSEVNWIAFDEPPDKLVAQVKIRYAHKAAPAVITPRPSEAGSGPTARVVFDRPQRAITPGQAAIFYSGDLVLGGGWINTVQDSCLDGQGLEAKVASAIT
jgi:tRNA-specific 2-thiouridylase